MGVLLCISQLFLQVAVEAWLRVVVVVVVVVKTFAADAGYVASGFLERVVMGPVKL